VHVFVYVFTFYYATWQYIAITSIKPYKNAQYVKNGTQATIHQTQQMST